MLKGIDAYLQAPLTDAERKEIETNYDRYQKESSFNGEPSFGTGGMRATVKAGTNHLNVYNIARLTMALSRALSSDAPGSLVVVAYDSRLSSPQFSRLTYHLLTAAGFRVKVFQRPTPTPMLSFAVRELGARAGIVITASHNPPEYNGYKVYGSDGAQIVPPFDELVQSKFASVAYSEIPVAVHEYAEKAIDPSDLIEEEIYQAYISRLKKESFIKPGQKSLKILYSPLHGTGGWIFERAFRDLGFVNFSVLEEQAQPDGNFPTVKSPNPEEESAFEKLVEKGRQTGAELLIATDPDADRVGIAVAGKNGYTFLTGNQAGTLLVESIAPRKAGSLKDPYICKTIVTTELQRHTAAAHGVRTIETLTGFKYIAEVVGQDSDNYVFGGEESYGYLPVDWVRDKDSLSSAVALATLATETSLLDSLDAIYLRDGLYTELLHNISLGGDNLALMDQIKEKLKKPAEITEGSIASRSILDILDLQKSGAEPLTAEAKHLQKNLASGLVVQYWLSPEGRVTIRPSGTEPKIKIYVSLRYAGRPNSDNLSEAKAELKQEAQAVLSDFLKKLGL